MADPYVTDQELLTLVKAARLPGDVAVRLAALLRATGSGGTGPTGPQGPAGPTGPAGPAGPGFADGDYGDITISGSVTALTVDNGVISNAKMADMAEARIKGRADGAGTGSPQDLAPADIADMFSFSLEYTIFGSGEDGDVHWDGTSVVLGFTPSSGVYTLTRDIAVNSAIHDSGVRINTNGFRIQCRNTWTFADSTSVISRDGSNGFNAAGTVPGSGASAVGAQILPGMVAGGIGGVSSSAGTAGAASSVAPRQMGAAGNTTGGTAGAIAGNGGTGNTGAQGKGGGGGGGGGSLTVAGTNGGASGALSLAAATTGSIDNVDQAAKGRHINSGTFYTLGTGGGGGGGGNNTGTGLGGTGGGGGGPGGYVYFASRRIAGPGTIRALGGNGGNGSSATIQRGSGGGGGGGPGGVVVVVVGRYDLSTPFTTDVSGGTGGTGGAAGPGGGGAGGNGGDGGPGYAVVFGGF